MKYKVAASGDPHRYATEFIKGNRIPADKVSIRVTPDYAILDVDDNVTLRQRLTSGNPQLKFGKVTGWFDVSANPINSFDFIPHFIGSPDRESYLDLSNTNINSLHNIHHHVRECHGFIHLDGLIDSHILGLVLIKGLMGVTFDRFDIHRDASTILTKHIQGDRDVLACQDEMIDAGCEKLAQL